MRNRALSLRLTGLSNRILILTPSARFGKEQKICLRCKIWIPLHGTILPGSAGGRRSLRLAPTEEKNAPIRLLRIGALAQVGRAICHAPVLVPPPTRSPSSSSPLPFSSQSCFIFAFDRCNRLIFGIQSGFEILCEGLISAHLIKPCRLIMRVSAELARVG